MSQSRQVSTSSVRSSSTQRGAKPAPAGTATSGSATPGNATPGSGRRERTRSIVPNYCETTSPENPNQEVVDALLNQVKCMYDRLIVGTPTVPGVAQVQEDMGKFQDLINCLENANANLERELARMNGELARLWGDLEEQLDHRAELEGLIEDLRRQINEIDQDLCLVTAERDQLLRENRSLAQRHEQCANTMAELQRERDDLYKKSLNNADGTTRSACMEDDYKRALAECCSRVDELTDKVGCLTAQLNRALRDKDDLQREKDELERKLNCLREKYNGMKCINDELIGKLKDKIKCLEKQLESACEKFKATLQAHHDELDKINGEKMRLQDLLDKEKRKNEDLERRLRDCEDRKKSDSRRSGPGSRQSEGYPKPSFHVPKDKPCDDKACSSHECDQNKGDIQKLEQQKLDLEKSRKCLENQVDCLTSQNRESTRHVEFLQDKVNCLEKNQAEIDRHSDANSTINAKLSQQSQVRESLEKRISQLEQELERKSRNSSYVQDKELEKSRNSSYVQDKELEKSRNSSYVQDKELEKSRNSSYVHDKELERKSKNSSYVQDIAHFEADKQKHVALMEEVAKEKEKLKYLATMKERIEGEIVRLREAISKQVIDRNEVDKLKADYQGQIESLQNKFDSQLEMNRQLAEINEQLGKQFKDRDLINSIRDSNEELLRKELSSVIAASKADIEKLKRIIAKRDEKVTSLRRAISLLKQKYISASQENDELLKKVQNLASSSIDSFLEMDSDSEENNNDLP